MKHWNVTHGRYRSLSYRTWDNMLQRCRNSKYPKYYDYGGRGIKVCERWLKFENFLADMGERPEGKSLDRIDVNGDYEPGNCKWATRKEQGSNRRDSIPFQGQSQSLLAWAEELGISYAALHCRITRGWSVEKAFSTPVKG